jgi:hypothetical protein
MSVRIEALREAEGIVRELCDLSEQVLKDASVIGPYTAFQYAADRLAALVDEAEEKATAAAPTAELLPKADVVAWLVKKAREGDPIENLASKVARGAIRPDNLRMLPPKFFEADRTYTRGIYEFRCLIVTTDPRSGEARAVGLRSRGGWPWDGAALDPDDWAHGGWTDTTGDGPDA